LFKHKKNLHEPFHFAYVFLVDACGLKPIICCNWASLQSQSRRGLYQSPDRHHHTTQRPKFLKLIQVNGPEWIAGSQVSPAQPSPRRQTAAQVREAHQQRFLVSTLTAAVLLIRR